MKKINVFSALIMVLLVFTACSKQYDSEADFRVTPLDDGKSAKITRYAGTKQTINIPPRIEGLSVGSIGIEAFAGKEIIHVTIPASVIAVGSDAFHDNPLISVTIGANVTLAGASGVNYPAFPDGFDVFYDRNGRLAGTYTRPSAGSTSWAKR